MGLFAPAEQCSAAATLGILYYIVLAHQVFLIEFFMENFGFSASIHDSSLLFAASISFMLIVGLFCWWEQKNFDLVWCRGTLREKIFGPWMDSIRTRGCEFLDGRTVTDFSLNEETGCISEVVCGKEKYNADAVILAVGISNLQELVKNRYVVLQLSLNFNYVLVIKKSSCIFYFTPLIRSCFDSQLFYVVQHCVQGKSFLRS